MIESSASPRLQINLHLPVQPLNNSENTTSNDDVSLVDIGWLVFPHFYFMRGATLVAVKVEIMHNQPHKGASSNQE